MFAAFPNFVFKQPTVQIQSLENKKISLQCQINGLDKDFAENIIAALSEAIQTRGSSLLSGYKVIEVLN